jgi:GT2 family glycosyltransferase
LWIGKGYSMNPRIICVIVTYNRLKFLKNTLAAYATQTEAPDTVLVVNNNSTDGTTEFLQAWEQKQDNFKKYVLTLPTNKGGSGGFYAGSKKALELGADWVWLADDDAYPAKDAVARTKAILASDAVDDTVAAICTSVYEEGKLCELHRKRIQITTTKILAPAVPASEYKKKCFALDLVSYVGAIFRAEVLKKVGLCDKDFFIYYDDTEHSYRVSKAGRILCFPEIRIDHDLKKAIVFEDTGSVDWRFYYKERNWFVTLKRHFPRQFKILWTQEYLKAKAHLLAGKKVPKYTVELAALLDAKAEHLGVHEIYKPGWQWK